MTKILIIEDEPLVREYVRLTFEKAGYEVRSVSDGPAGIALVEADVPDAVVLDFKLPGMSGRQVLHTLKGMVPSLPVFIYSAYSDTQDRSAELCEADGYFVKWGDLGPLLEAVDRKARPEAQ